MSENKPKGALSEVVSATSVGSSEKGFYPAVRIGRDVYVQKRFKPLTSEDLAISFAASLVEGLDYVVTLQIHSHQYEKQS